MAKGDDAVRRKRSKAERKRMQKDSKVSARVAALIAAKRRRKTGKRRICEGMCYSLPTLEDPFNDRNDRKYIRAKNDVKPASRQVNTKTSLIRTGSAAKNVNAEDVKASVQKPKNSIVNERSPGFPPLSGDNAKLSKEQSYKQQGIAAKHVLGMHRNSDSLSKYLILCLHEIQTSWMEEGTFDGTKDRHLLADNWGIELWKCCSDGFDILETSRASPTRDQIAWLVCTAADIVTRKEKEGQYVSSPFLLYLVPSQEEAIKVRSLCKPLKALGIHTVSLHAGAPVDHQVQGLRSCEPEFLVSTPERLLELVSLRAIDISQVSLLVLNGLESFSNGGTGDALKAIRHHIQGDLQTVIFSDSYGSKSTEIVQDLLTRPIWRTSVDESVTSQSACISQCLSFCTSEDEKILKAINIFKEACGNRKCSSPLKGMGVAGTADKAKNLITAFGAEGFDVTGEFALQQEADTVSNHDSESRAAVLVTDEQQLVGRTDIEEFDFIVFVDFPSLGLYVQTLTRMSRYSAHGALHSFICQANASSAGPLIPILEQCAQPVPEELRHYLDSSTKSEPPK